MPTKISIPIDAKVLFEMYQYAAYAKHHFRSEVAGWGHYKQDKGIYKLAPLPTQEITGATADTSSLCIINDVNYDISDLMVHWHSHVDMVPNPSSVDTQQIRETMELYPMLISIIVNCKNQYTARLDVKTLGGRNGFRLTSAETYDVELVPYYNNTSVSKEIQKKLKRPKPPKPKIIEVVKATSIPFQYSQGLWHNNYRPADSIPQTQPQQNLFATVKGSEVEMADYIPPKSNKPEDVMNEINRTDLLDMLAVVDELAKMEGVTKEELKIQGVNKGFIVTGKKAPYTLGIRIDDEKTIKFRFNGEDTDCVIATLKFVEMLRQYADISQADYQRLMALIN